MIQPSREQFHNFAADCVIVPIWRQLLADQTTPVSSYQRVVQGGHGFLLESVERGERWGRHSFLGRQPLALLRSYGQKVEITQPPTANQPASDLSYSSSASAAAPTSASASTSILSHPALASVPTDRGMLAALDVLLPQLKTPKIPDLPVFTSGLVGYLGYDIVREVEQLPNRPSQYYDLADSYLSLVGQVAAFDHWKQNVTLVHNVLIPPQASAEELDQLYDFAAGQLEAFAQSGTKAEDEFLFPPPASDLELPQTRASVSPEQYKAAVAAAKEFILEGDIFQVVLSERFDFELDALPLDVYRVLRQINPSPYMYYFAFPELEPETFIIGSSPEPLVQIKGERVISRPIAGTRPRGKSELEDARLAAELLEHPKEKAEHVMLVDLARNDISRVIEFNTLRLEELMTLEPYSHVMHMTSQVSGTLRQGKTAVDVLRATIPAGTVSGAPKVRAMEIIDSLEPEARGPYAGTVGYIDLSGNIDAAITIRTMIVQGNQASVQAGAGIVADSVPEEEELECRNKAKALLAAVPAARQMSQLRQKS